jgi:phosphate transport system protein
MTIRHFDVELAELRRSLAGMADLVQQSLRTASASIQRPTVDARELVRGIEERLDVLDTEIEDRCHRIMALQGPVAGDLRLLISALHITADLEQIGDLSESVCKRAAWIARHAIVENPPELAVLCQHATTMVGEALDAFVSGADHAGERAGRVLVEERLADDSTKQCYRWIQDAMAKQTDRIREYTHLLRAVAHLEHIADIAVAIAQEAVYVHLGRNIRHQHGALDGDTN